MAKGMVESELVAQLLKRAEREEALVDAIVGVLKATKGNLTSSYQDVAMAVTQARQGAPMPGILASLDASHLQGDEAAGASTKQSRFAALKAGMPPPPSPAPTAVPPPGLAGGGEELWPSLMGDGPTPAGSALTAAAAPFTPGGAKGTPPTGRLGTPEQPYRNARGNTRPTGVYDAGAVRKQQQASPAPMPSAAAPAWGGGGSAWGGMPPNRPGPGPGPGPGPAGTSPALAAPGVAGAMNPSDDAKRRRVVKKDDFYLVENIPGKGRINILEGLELHTRVLDEAEHETLVARLWDLKEQGHAGELRGRTFLAPRKTMRGKGRVTAQFGCCYNYARGADGTPPGITKDFVEPMPSFLQEVIERLVRWGIFSSHNKPDTCIVNYYDTDDCIPPHIDHHDFSRPFCTMSLLVDAPMVLGSSIKIMDEGQFKGGYSITLPKGSVLVLKGNGADVAKHCIPSVPSPRISVTFRKMQPSKVPRPMKAPEYVKPGDRPRGSAPPPPPGLGGAGDVEGLDEESAQYMARADGGGIQIDFGGLLASANAKTKGKGGSRGGKGGKRGGGGGGASSSGGDFVSHSKADAFLSS